MIKINEINKTKVEIKAKTKRKINSKIRISIIIFIIKKSLTKRASTRKRKIEIIKSFINMFFIKRLYDIRAYKKTFFDLFKCEQCDLNHIIA